MRLGDIAVPRDREPYGGLKLGDAGVRPMDMAQEVDQEFWSEFAKATDTPPTAAPPNLPDGPKLPPYTREQLQWLAHELSHDFRCEPNGYDRVRWNNRAMGMAFNTIAMLRKAVSDFLKHENSELCHDRRGELATAFDLPACLAHVSNIETLDSFSRGCNAYQRELFGKSDREVVINALLAVLQDEGTGAEVAEKRYELARLIGTGMADEINRLLSDRHMLRSVNRLRIGPDGGNYWSWGDDGQDHPESLTCPALVQPDVMRRLVAAEQQLNEIKARGRWPE